MEHLLHFFEKLPGVNGKKWELISVEYFDKEDDCRMRYLQAISTTRNSSQATRISWHVRTPTRKDGRFAGKLVAKFSIPKCR